MNPPDYRHLLPGEITREKRLVLDAGCGPGRLAQYLAERVTLVIALDYSYRMLRMARSLCQDSTRLNVSFVCADLHNPPFPAGSFDLVASDCVLHDTALDKSLPNLFRLLSPGGEIFLRDLITAYPSRAKNPLWQVQRTLREIPRYLRKLKISETVRLLRFELSPTWIRHKCSSNHMNYSQFIQAYSAVFPAALFLNMGWAAVCYAPGEPDRYKIPDE